MKLYLRKNFIFNFSTFQLFNFLIFSDFCYDYFQKLKKKNFKPTKAMNKEWNTSYKYYRKYFSKKQMDKINFDAQYRADSQN
ncbi:MAG: hypothetical protein ACJAV6_000188 [Candidatus Paceibacteria bacterium]|jgi:hypothetical protein